MDPREYEHRLAELIECTDWEWMTLRLLPYAAGVLRRHGAAAERYGKTPHDFVDEAVALVLDGVRRVPFEKQIPFEIFLRGVIKSLISHAGDRQTVDLLSIAPEREEIAAGEISESRLPLSTPNHEEEILSRTKEERFLLSLASDPELQRYVTLKLSETYSTAEEYAKVLGVPVAAVRAMDKRLNRRRKQWQNL